MKTKNHIYKELYLQYYEQVVGLIMGDGYMCRDRVHMIKFEDGAYFNGVIIWDDTECNGIREVVYRRSVEEKDIVAMIDHDVFTVVGAVVDEEYEAYCNSCQSQQEEKLKDEAKKRLMNFAVNQLNHISKKGK